MILGEVVLAPLEMVDYSHLKEYTFPDNNQKETEADRLHPFRSLNANSKSLMLEGLYHQR